MKLLTLSVDDIKRNIFRNYMDFSLGDSPKSIRNSLDDLHSIITALYYKNEECIVNYFKEGNSYLALSAQMSKEIQDCDRECILIIKDKEGTSLFAITGNHIKFSVVPESILTR